MASYGLAVMGLALAMILSPDEARAAPPDEAARHLLAAEGQAARDPTLRQRRERWCKTAAAPADATLAEQAVRVAEEAYRNAAGAATPPARAALRSLVVQRECAALHAARLQPQVRRPVWLISELTIVRVGASSSTANGMEVVAVARNVNGPVVNSRITFSQGVHMSCFGVTDVRGSVRCTLVDTHPHGPESAHGTDDEAHEGPLIATLAGSTSADRVELPAVVQQSLPRRHAARMPHPPT